MHLVQSFQELPNMRAALQRAKEDNYFELDISNLKSDLDAEAKVKRSGFIKDCVVAPEHIDSVGCLAEDRMRLVES